MTMPPSPPPPLPHDGDDHLLIGAYLDGELDARAVLDVERRLERDPSLRAEHDRLVALQAALRGTIGREAASATLRRRVEGSLSRNLAGSMPRPQPFRPGGADWRRIAAAAILTAMVASSGTMLALREDAATAALSQIVAEHRRTLLSATPLDVDSADTHTVKPWFDTKLALSPQVIDLAQHGYPLTGGRVDVVGGQLVPAMIYRRRAHLISLVAVPRHDKRHDKAAAASSQTQDGYTVLGWHGQDFDYFATSDVAAGELAEFVRIWRAAAAQ